MKTVWSRKLYSDSLRRPLVETFKEARSTLNRYFIAVCEMRVGRRNCYVRFGFFRTQGQTDSLVFLLIGRRRVRPGTYSKY